MLIARTELALKALVDVGFQSRRIAKRLQSLTMSKIKISARGTIINSV